MTLASQTPYATQTTKSQFLRNNDSKVTASSSKLVKSQSALPIASHQSEILSALSSSPVLILSGETGSGKSTQLPQYLLSAPWHRKSQRVAVTQPRRVAAISLARRVATELGTALGKAGGGARVGYSVRFDANVGRQNELVYLTEGMLLVELMADPGLCKYEVVVVDEVHERGVNVDLLLGFLRELVCGRGKGAEVRREKGAGGLRVVVMSATADVEALKAFFDEGFGLQARERESDGRPNGAGVSNVKPDESTNTSDKSNSAPQPTTEKSPAESSQKVSTVAVAGRQYPVQVTYLPSPTDDFTEAALKCIFQVHCKEPMPGDVLVFMTGQETIQGLQRNIEEYAQSLGPEFPKLLVLPIYAALPQAAQQLVFEPAPPNTRKIILATNIAETSITVPGVRFVIDSGKEKRKQFRPRLGLESLLVKSISKSSAIQRKGRAGREAAGKCWRLYTQQGYDTLEQATSPEILRCDLADAILKMKANGVDDVVNFPLLTPPSRDALARSLLQLFQLQALDDAGKVNDLGRQLSRFPLTPSYGRVLLAAAETDCLLPAIDIIACFSADNAVFLSTDTEEARDEAASARASLLRRQGDHLTLLATVQAYAAEHADRKAWCKTRRVNHRAMQNILDIRKQLRAQCQTMKLLAAEEWASDAAAEKILKCFLPGFRQNVARLVPDGSYRTFVGNQTVAIHPSSVLFGKKVEGILYNEFVFTNRAYARGVSAVQMDWVGEVLGN
ncbi:P-loop containing nucleoside triphosphate hydrolase protein [Myriangium duriaei CBS 260.36]|uniref:RNA helicase n=1 Tax=Myriangium duriaei CBS 260.36 TaxID=1168546 RepID=A0A9P4MJE9_9PEZI|nr:P-loop containing nucleoside triphosphate hydrolase protein [Myriangium duriaei CBS 260.36]